MTWLNRFSLEIVGSSIFDALIVLHSTTKKHPFKMNGLSFFAHFFTFHTSRYVLPRSALPPTAAGLISKAPVPILLTKSVPDVPSKYYLKRSTSEIPHQISTLLQLEFPIQMRR
jgi:hypothetical protein